MFLIKAAKDLFYFIYFFTFSNSFKHLSCNFFHNNYEIALFWVFSIAKECTISHISQPPAHIAGTTLHNNIPRKETWKVVQGRCAYLLVICIFSRHATRCVSSQVDCFFVTSYSPLITIMLRLQHNVRWPMFQAIQAGELAACQKIGSTVRQIEFKMAQPNKKNHLCLNKNYPLIASDLCRLRSLLVFQGFEVRCSARKIAFSSELHWRFTNWT